MKYFAIGFFTAVTSVASFEAAAWGNPYSNPGYQAPYTITDTYNPLNSYTVTPSYGGNATITNTYNPLESYTYQPNYGGGGTITNTYNPLNSWSIGR